METQYKILFLKNLIDESIKKINISDLNKYKSVIEISNETFSVEITYNGLVIFSENQKYLTISEMYVIMCDIIENLISGEIKNMAKLKFNNYENTTNA